MKLRLGQVGAFPQSPAGQCRGGVQALLVLTPHFPVLLPCGHHFQNITRLCGEAGWDGGIWTPDPSNYLGQVIA